MRLYYRKTFTLHGTVASLTIHVCFNVADMELTKHTAPCVITDDHAVDVNLLCKS